MVEFMEVLDATGNLIVEGSGQSYGYAQNVNGANKVTFGTVEKITPTGMVTLKVDSQWTSVYMEPLERGMKSAQSKRITVKPFMLFKV